MESYKSDSQIEESSWTYYLQDFDSNEEYSNLSSEYETPSLTSDAASSAVKKMLVKNTKGLSTARNNFGLGSDSRALVINNKQASFKKQRGFDFDLEDTASSPIISPKEISYKAKYMDHKDSSFKFQLSTGDFSSSSHVVGSHYWDTKKKSKGHKY